MIPEYELCDPILRNTHRGSIKVFKVCGLEVAVGSMNRKLLLRKLLMKRLLWQEKTEMKLMTNANR